MGTADDRTIALDVDGLVEPGYGVVVDAVRRNLAEHGEVGTALCVHVDGIPVVDVAGGHVAEGVPYRRDTAQMLFSATKGVTAVVASMLAERGVLDLDAPVASVWPDFAANGKDEILMRWILTHQSGVLATGRAYQLDEMLDGRAVIADLAQAVPAWRPGTQHGYAAHTFGWVMAEVIRRVDGRSVGTIVAEDIARPLGLDLWIGAPADVEERIAPVLAPETPPDADERFQALFAPGSLAWRSLTFDGSLDFARLTETYNRRDVHAAEVPADDGIGTAHSLSRLYAACIGEVDGIRLLGPEQVDGARTEAVRGIDAVFGVETAFGLGFTLPTKHDPMLGPGSFGNDGPTCLGLADPDTGVAFCWVANQLGELAGDPRPLHLIGAVRAAVGA